MSFNSVSVLFSMCMFVFKSKIMRAKKKKKEIDRIVN